MLGLNKAKQSICCFRKLVSNTMNLYLHRIRIHIQKEENFYDMSVPNDEYPGAMAERDPLAALHGFE